MKTNKKFRGWSWYLLAIIAVLVLGGCSDDPTGPGPCECEETLVGMEGDWTGTAEGIILELRLGEDEQYGIITGTARIGQVGDSLGLLVVTAGRRDGDHVRIALNDVLVVEGTKTGDVFDAQLNGFGFHDFDLELARAR